MNSIDRFSKWFHSESPNLRVLSSIEAAEKIQLELSRVDEGLGVEIARAPAGQLLEDILITAFANEKLFSVVHQIASHISSLGWNVRALKPPRGFEFKITVGEGKLEAKKLRFRHISGVKRGYQLLIPDLVPTGDGAEEMAWLIVETGIGEELASKISHLEFSDNSLTDDSFPIDQLVSHLMM